MKEQACKSVASLAIVCLGCCCWPNQITLITRLWAQIKPTKGESFIRPFSISGEILPFVPLSTHRICWAKMLPNFKQKAKSKSSRWRKRNPKGKPQILGTLYWPHPPVAAPFPHKHTHNLPHTHPFCCDCSLRH